MSVLVGLAATTLVALVAMPTVTLGNGGNILREGGLRTDMGQPSTAGVAVEIRAFVGTATLYDCVPVQVNGTSMLAWNNVTLPPGRYALSAPDNISGSSACNPSFATYGFQAWTFSSNLTVQNPNSNQTNLTVRGSGVLSVLYNGWEGPWACAASPSALGSSCSPNSPVLVVIIAVIVLAVAALAAVVVLMVARHRRGPRGPVTGVPPPPPL